MKLDFGSGYNPKEGFKTCDVTMSPFLDYSFDTSEYKVSCPDSSFEEINVRNVLHHVKDLKKLFQEFKRILTPNGILVITEPRLQFYKQNIILDTIWYRYVIPRYEVWFSPEYRNYTELLPEFFQLVDVRYENEKEIVTCSMKI